MRLRMKDIARDLGLSAVTVSKALRHHPDISEETRNRILKRIKELDYRPNFAARALITGRTWTVGLVVPDLLHPFFAQVAEAISAEIRKTGYSLILASSEDDPDLERQQIEQLLAHRVDVILVASTQWSVESFRKIEEQNIPYVLVDRKFAGLTANFVGTDDEAAGFMAASHLIEQGCKRVAHIRGPEISTAFGRLEGYKRALASQGVPSRAEYVVSIGHSGDHHGDLSAYEVTRKLLALDSRPDGIFCYNDPVAIGAMRAILDAGVSIPEEIAVVGCGNVLNSDFFRVPLSTIDQDSEGVGEKAAKLAMSLVGAKTPVRPKTELITPRLLVRSSSRRNPVLK
jgi:LacI family transcriptional regulator, galactose operon repressor